MRNLLWIGAALVVAACNNTSFKSAPQRKSADQNQSKPTPPGQKTFKLACKGDEGVAQLVQDVKGDARTQVRLEGEFCGLGESEASGSLTVLFVVDYSGSMLENDPEVDGSCGRLKAAQALVQKLEGMAKPGVDIKVGLLPFGDYALPAVAPAAIAAFKASLTREAFCSTDGGATNYEAAFVGAQQTLAGLTGPKAVYLISDGLPTRSGTDASAGDPLPPLGGSTEDLLVQVQEAGRKAAQALRAGDLELTLNAIFLGQAADPTGGLSTIPGLSNVDPQKYLESITGDKTRVRLVTDADDLAAEIVTLDTPDVVTLDKGSVKGSLKAASFGDRPVTLATLEQDPSRKGVWVFTTEPFELYGREGQPIANEITLAVTTSDGKEHRATARLNFAVEKPAQQP